MLYREFNTLHLINIIYLKFLSLYLFLFCLQLSNKIIIRNNKACVSTVMVTAHFIISEHGLEITKSWCEYLQTNTSVKLSWKTSLLLIACFLLNSAQICSRSRNIRVAFVFGICVVLTSSLVSVPARLDESVLTSSTFCRSMLLLCPCQRTCLILSHCTFHIKGFH